jgi:predicted RNase H-like HicB family nuclease
MGWTPVPAVIVFGFAKERRITVILRGDCLRDIKIVVEKHPDGYVAYPLGVRGVVVGEGDTYEEALVDLKSAIRFHMDSFGTEALDIDPPVLEAFVADARIED